MLVIIFSGLGVNMLATGSIVGEFNPRKGRWSFNGNKNPLHDFLQRRSKASGPTLQDFTAC
jgi:hypothetical protein